MLDSMDTDQPTDTALIPAFSGASCLDDTTVDILLAEDMLSDALLVRLALDAAHIPYRLRTIRGGDEVVPWLMHEYKNPGGRLPDVIMLDLGLPRMDGFEIMAELADAPMPLRAIPIAILTGYEDFEYIGRNNNLYIPAYIPKPCDAKKIHGLLQRFRPRHTAQA